MTKGYIGRMIKEGRLHLIKGKLNVAMSDAELDNKSNDDKAPNYWRGIICKIGSFPFNRFSRKKL